MKQRRRLNTRALKASPWASGFTLVEMLVSVAIFTIVMVIALGALLSMTESDRRAQTLKTITNNLNFSLDAMSRSIRTGLNYTLTGTTQITFLAADGLTTSYCRGSGTSCSPSGTSILRSTGASYAPVISPEVVVTALTFVLVGGPLGDNIQPKVTILLRGYVQVTATQQSKFDLQTTVTQRLYDQ